MEKTNETLDHIERINKQLFKKSEVFDGFRYVRWNICLEYAEEIKEQELRDFKSSIQRFIKELKEDFTNDREEYMGEYIFDKINEKALEVFGDGLIK